MKINDPYATPDVSQVAPVYVPQNHCRSFVMDVVFINGYGRYQTVAGCWNNIQKCWEYASNGEKIEYEVVKTEARPETKIHYPL